MQTAHTTNDVECVLVSDELRTANAALAISLVLTPNAVASSVALNLPRAARRLEAAAGHWERLGDMTGTMLQTFGGIKVVKAFHGEERDAVVAAIRSVNKFSGRMNNDLRRRAVTGETGRQC